MGPFHHPTARFPSGLATFRVSFLLALLDYEADSGGQPRPGGPDRPCIRHRRRGAAVVRGPVSAAPAQSGPEWAAAISRHARWPRWRRATAGRHARRPANFACAHFSPRSVGFGPTHSIAKGAFPVAPSMLCHSHAMPSIPSYSTRPERHKFTKKPACCHC